MKQRVLKINRSGKLVSNIDLGKVGPGDSSEPGYRGLSAFPLVASALLVDKA